MNMMGIYDTIQQCMGTPIAQRAFGLSRLKLSSIRCKNGKYYLIDTCDTVDCGLETEVFNSRKQPASDDLSKINFNKINFNHVCYREHYATEAEAIEGHKRVVTMYED